MLNSLKMLLYQRYPITFYLGWLLPETVRE